MVNVTYRREHLPHRAVKYHLEAEGHAGYSVNGEPDIVCAGVSTLMYTLANYLDYIHADELEANDKDDFLIECEAPFNDEPVHRAFQMTVFGLTLMEEQYPDNVQIVVEPDE